MVAGLKTVLLETRLELSPRDTVSSTRSPEGDRPRKSFCGHVETQKVVRTRSTVRYLLRVLRTEVPRIQYPSVFRLSFPSSNV